MRALRAFVVVVVVVVIAFLSRLNETRRCPRHRDRHRIDRAVSRHEAVRGPVRFEKAVRASEVLLLLFDGGVEIVIVIRCRGVARREFRVVSAQRRRGVRPGPNRRPNGEGDERGERKE